MRVYCRFIWNYENYQFFLCLFAAFNLDVKS